MSSLSGINNIKNGNSNKSGNVYVMLKIGNEFYAINVMKVTMISSITDFRSMPNSESYMAGIMNVQGEIIPVVDMRKKFGLAQLGFTKTTAVVIVNVRSDMAGLIVDSVADVVTLDFSKIQLKSTALSKRDSCITGAVEYRENIILFLDPDEIVQEEVFEEVSNIDLS